MSEDSQMRNRLEGFAIEECRKWKSLATNFYNLMRVHVDDPEEYRLSPKQLEKRIKACECFEELNK